MFQETMEKEFLMCVEFPGIFPYLPGNVLYL